MGAAVPYVVTYTERVERERIVFAVTAAEACELVAEEAGPEFCEVVKIEAQP